MQLRFQNLKLNSRLIDDGSNNDAVDQINSDIILSHNFAHIKNSHNDNPTNSNSPR